MPVALTFIKAMESFEYIHSRDWKQIKIVKNRGEMQLAEHHQIEN